MIAAVCVLIASSTTADVKLYGQMRSKTGWLGNDGDGTDSMVRRILFAFCRGIGASVRLEDQPGGADGTRMEPLPRMSPT